MSDIVDQLGRLRGLHPSIPHLFDAIAEITRLRAALAERERDARATVDGAIAALIDLTDKSPDSPIVAAAKAVMARHADAAPQARILLAISLVAQKLGEARAALAAAPVVEGIELQRDVAGNGALAGYNITARHVPGTPQPVRDTVGRYALVRIA